MMCGIVKSGLVRFHCIGAKAWASVFSARARASVFSARARASVFSARARASVFSARAGENLADHLID